MTILATTFRKGTAVSAAAPFVGFAPVNKKTPVVTGYRCTGDAAGALFNIYTGALVSHCKVSASAQVILLVNSTTGFTGGDRVLLVTAAGVVYWRTINTVQAGVSLTLTANVGVLTTVNDVVYRMDLVASMPCGSATVANNGGPLGIAYGKKSMPIVGAVVGGTSANVITGFEVSYATGLEGSYS